MKYTKHHSIYIKNILLILLSFIFMTGLFSANTEAKGEDNTKNKFTGHWQFSSSIQDIPNCGYVLLSYAKDTSKLFYGSLDASDSDKVTYSLEEKNLQINDNTENAFMLIQDKDMFYIRLSNENYLKVTGDLTNAQLTETDNIEEAAAFRIEQAGYGTNNYAYYKIFVPYAISDLSLVVENGHISLSTACYSGFYVMAESTKVKEPPFGNLTKLVRFLAVVIVVFLLCIVLYLYRKNTLSLIYFGISSICIIALLVFFMIFAITTTQPGLYVLYQSTFETTEIQPLENRETHKSYYEIVEDGSAIFSFEGNEQTSYIWGCLINDENVFTTTSSGNYNSGLYTIWLRPYAAGTYNVVFYYYDVTKDLSTTIECKTFQIEIDENKHISLIKQHMGEV